jgi:urea transport system ATP-binding protein
MFQVHNLSAAYGQSEVLHAIDMSAQAGEIVALVGRNGMGKSTLMKSLMGVMPARTGRIIVDGADVAGLPSYQRVAHGLAYVPQGRQIFGTMTVRENIETGLVVTGKSQVPQQIYDLFPILAEFGGRRGGNLSGGQQQQLAIGRALVMRPKLLLLDEPTEGIQPSIIKDIGRAISYLRSLGNMAIVLVEQYLDFACELGDSFAVMDRGAVKYTCDRSKLDPAEISRQMAL